MVPAGKPELIGAILASTVQGLGGMGSSGTE
jgi:hypothetical protein